MYHQLKELLRNDIESGRYGPGDRLPTEHELCTTYGLSRTPVGRALSELADEGLIVRHRRRGSFVNESWEPGPSARPHLTMLLPEASVVPAPSRAVTGAAIDITPVAVGETNSQLQRLAAEGAAPDLALIDLGRLASLVEGGLVRPLDAPVGAPPRSPLLGPVRTSSVYAVPAAVTLSGLWVRSELIPLADGWEGLLETVRAMRDNDPAVVSPIVLDGQGNAAVDALLTVVASNEPGDAPLRFGSDGARGAFRFLHGLVEEGLMTSDVVRGDAGRSAVARMQSGEAVAMVGSSADIVRLGSAAGDMSFVPFPGGPGGSSVSLVSGWGVVVTRQSRYPELAMRVAGEIAHQGDVQTAAALGLLPAMPVHHIADADGALPGLAAILESTGRARPWEAGLPVLAAQIERVLAAVISGRLRPGAAADASQEVLEAVRAAAPF